MFKKFGKEEISGYTQVKASVARGIRSSIGEQYPFLAESGVLDVLLPKKDPLFVAKTSSYMQVAFLNEVPLFYSDRDNHWFPTLRILHQYPHMMPKLRTDKGAIKFVLSGANIMCPGLTSAGATIHDEVGQACAGRMARSIWNCCPRITGLVGILAGVLPAGIWAVLAGTFLLNFVLLVLSWGA
eukprot:GHRQ01012218.1.p1 GENE.GHRQ01012218.1~~GHRQ01012218.1.p1  ORF type:complete len:184 (+),score=29.86 GHRQ01012218.1:169-720(+)